mgnify:FL=1
MVTDFSISNGIFGAHLSNNGLTSSFDNIEVPTHRHDVEMDLRRASFSIMKSINEEWDATLMIPYFWKIQKASISFLEPANPIEAEYAKRSGYIHHRTENYDGFGDVEFMAGYKKRDLFKDGSVLRLGMGLALPSGITESDPWVLGDFGRKHLHIQFGNGTVDPLLNLYYGFQINDSMGLGLYAKARLPLYHNNKGFRGASELAISPMVNWTYNEKLSFSAGLSIEYYGYSDWLMSGRDPNSGFLHVSAALNLSYALSESFDIGFGITKPLHQSFYGEGEDFEIAPSATLSLRRFF